MNAFYETKYFLGIVQMIFLFTMFYETNWELPKEYIRHAATIPMETVFVDFVKYCVKLQLKLKVEELLITAGRVGQIAGKRIFNDAVSLEF